jgi:hypothetical protein
MYVSRRSEPFTWREPTHETRRCPKCHARLVVSAVEERCPYCGYHQHKALPAAERAEPAVLPSLANQIQEAIGEAPDEYGRPPARFISYELPRELNFERYLLALLSLLVLLLLDLRWGSPSVRYNILPLGAPQYVWYAVLLPSVLYMLTTFSTFFALKPLTVLVGLASAALGAYILLDPRIVPGIWNAATEPWLAQLLLGYQVIAGFWAASIAWRDWCLLRG